MDVLTEPLSIMFRSMGAILIEPIYYVYILGGSFIGILFGAIPGLTGTTAVIMLLPITFLLPINLSLVFLLSIFKGGMFGGSIAAILIGIPGSPGAVATSFDGYPLGQEGKGLKAIKLALFSSVQGDLTSDILTVIFAPFVVILVLYISSPEIFIIIMATLLFIGVLTESYSKETLLACLSKAIIAGVGGIMVRLIGMEPIFGTSRFTFGNYQLLGGLNLIPVFLGLFGLSRVLTILVEPSDVASLKKIHLPKPRKLSDTKLSLKEYLFCQKVIVFGTFLGTLFGIIPGIGSNAAALVAHGQGKELARDKKNYGKGALEGVAVAESANSAVNGANLLPLVTLGIPGSAEAAVLIAAFLMQGIQVGPLLIKNEPEIIYSMFGGMILANLGVLFVGIIALPIFIKAISLPKNILFPIIGILIFAGSFAREQRFFHFWVIIAFGVIGYFMCKFGFSVASFCIGFILGRYAEIGFNHTLVITHENFLELFSRPAFLIVLAIIIIMWGLIVSTRIKQKTYEKKA